MDNVLTTDESFSYKFVEKEVNYTLGEFESLFNLEIIDGIN